MSEFVPISKDEEREQPVPSAWRATLTAIVDALKRRDYQFDGIQNVDAVEAKTAKAIAANIMAYGHELTALPAESWQTSVCSWQLDYWDILVDLFTVDEGRSDLVLHLRALEDETRVRFQLHLVYVP